MNILGHEASRVKDVPLVQQLHCFCLAMKSYMQDSRVIPVLPRNQMYTSKVISTHVHVRTPLIKYNINPCTWDVRGFMCTCKRSD